MKKYLLVLLVMAIQYEAPSQGLEYFLPDSVTYNPAIPKPKDIIYHEVGEYHVTHDRLVNYMKTIAMAAPERVKLETMGFTYENRPQVLLIITSPKNHQRLEEIRQQHVQLTDPTKSASLDIENMPIVVWIGHSIHGNEQSGSNAALVTAYYLAAAQGKQVDDLLEHTVILFDPSFNPDGMQRFSSWVNQNRSKNLVSDPSDREFNETWPGGRFNHYWFDLNRDWLPAVHIESQNRLKWFHLWKPNILTDHHEQGSNATFFFQPGVPSRVNPLTPARNQELTGKLAKFHAAFLDRIGSLYFTKENYDDFYYGKGSTYPDINGAIGILFEQASSRGHLQQTANGLLSFPFTIKNQFITALSTLEGAKALRLEFLKWQRDFYKESMAESATTPVKGYLFADGKDRMKAFYFIEMLRRHQIEVYALKNKITADGNDFNPGASYIIPSNQPQYKVIRAIFDKTLTYKDSLFYDITAWTMPLAFGLPSAELSSAQYNTNLLGDKIAEVSKPQGSIFGGSGKSEYAYLFPWDELNAPAALYELQKAGVLVKVSTTRFEIPWSDGSKKMDYGTIMIPVKSQIMTSDKLYEIIKAIVIKNGVNALAVQGGNSIEGSDLGSAKFVVIAQPKIAMITGAGVNATDAGEVWHLLDQRMNIPATHLDNAEYSRATLSKYNTLIMVGGNYKLDKAELKAWVQEGGTLIVLEEAINWTVKNEISTVSFKKAKNADDSLKSAVYVDKEQVDGAQQVSGAIFGASVDLTHPLAYGYHDKTVSLFKANKVFMEKSKNPYASPFQYGAKPLQSGWVSRENADAIKNGAAVIVNALGTGRVINIADNPNFRAFWLSGTKLFMNAIFFGRIINAATARVAE